MMVLPISFLPAVVLDAAPYNILGQAKKMTEQYTQSIERDVCRVS